MAVLKAHFWNSHQISYLITWKNTVGKNSQEQNCW